MLLLYIFLYSLNICRKWLKVVNVQLFVLKIAFTDLLKRLRLYLIQLYLIKYNCAQYDSMVYGIVTMLDFNGKISYAYKKGCSQW